MAGDALMTQEYLVGELSARLGQLQTVAPHPAVRDDVACLRRQVEDGPVARLAADLARALALADRMCWDSLSRGDALAFDRQAAVSADLRLFGACARLVDDE
jgi:hypothetical protein